MILCVPCMCMVAKISIYNCSFGCELVLSLSWVPLKRRADTKNKTISADIAGGEMIEFLDTCG